MSRYFTTEDSEEVKGKLWKKKKKFLSKEHLHFKGRIEKRQIPESTNVKFAIDAESQINDGESRQGKARFFAEKRKVMDEDERSNVKHNETLLNEDGDPHWKRPNSFAKKKKHFTHRQFRKDLSPVERNEILIKQSKDPFPGKAKVSKQCLDKYTRGKESLKAKNKIMKRFGRKKKPEDKKSDFGIEQAARSEILLVEESGYMEADEGEDLNKLTQHEIAAAVDITSATKYFDLRLVDFGPYSIDYTHNGRHLVIGGKKGHLAAMDWISKRLSFEINVMEEIKAVKWFHQETMLAAAQKEWVYVYDNQGVEVHCIKQLYHVLGMEFLLHPLLLATSSARGYVSWLDITRGEIVAQFPTYMGRLDVMCQNPALSTIALGHSQGVVSMWTPNNRKPVLKMLCHYNPVRSVAINSTGIYMATSCIDGTLKIWDLRQNYKCLQNYKLGKEASKVVFSQTNHVAVSMGHVAEVYKNCCTETVSKPYLRHKSHDSIHAIKFCPYEDVLGIGHQGGFTSILVPGAGEANFDALESNPFQTKSQRKEAEVNLLLEKIQPEMIGLDPTAINRIPTETINKKWEEKKKFLETSTVPKVDFTPRYKKKGKGDSLKTFQRKIGVQEEEKRQYVKKLNNMKTKESKAVNYESCLDRFNKK